MAVQTLAWRLLSGRPAAKPVVGVLRRAFQYGWDQQPFYRLPDAATL